MARLQLFARMLLAAALGGTVLLAVRLVVGLGSVSLESQADRWLGALVPLAAGLALCLRSLRAGRELAGWLLLGLALISWSGGALWYSVVHWNLDVIPYPSVADALWILFYPLALAGLVSLAAARTQNRSTVSWFDGTIGALAIASLGAAVAFEHIVESTSGSTLAIGTNLAYPLGDLALMALVAGVIPFAGWKLGRSWFLLALGLGVFGISDTVYLYRIADGSYVPGTVLDAGWLAAASIVALAGWQRVSARKASRSAAWAAFVFPGTAGAIALAILVYDHFARVHLLALGLAAASLVAVLARMTLIFRENLAMIAHSRAEASTDPLTGLGNRRKLSADLEAVSDRATLVLLDLDGFKAYNDTYGHVAGDSLLDRLGAALTSTLADRATAYRMGGDEFCVLAVAEPDADELASIAAGALCETGDGFHISSSYGVVSLPEEASDTSSALRLADARMYAQKQRQRSSAGSQSKDVLLRALQERSPSLVDHVSDVADLAVDVGRKLGLANHDLEQLRHVAELHDVGKVAIPDAILEKHGPLDPSEWAFVYQHTLIGERIIAAAPALLPVSRAVRSTHERWDGLGYPDQLSGDAIPLVARIVAACDALAAMVSDRPYRQAVDLSHALEELDRCAGTQFDVAVVRAVRAVLTQPVTLAA